MNGALLYLDSSSVVKLVVQEQETSALQALLVKWPARISSALVRVEAPRVLRRGSAPAEVRRRGDEILRD